MATQMGTLPRLGRSDDGFFRTGAIVMTLVIIAGFSLNFIMGRSSFSAPPLVHAHAVIFMGWVAIYLAQTMLATGGTIALHRRLGWIGAGWTLLMIGAGGAVTIAMVQRGTVPFFFLPQQFLIFDPLSLLAFAGLTAAAIALRRQTDWHRRLHFCAMSILLAPALGRLLPMPLIAPWAFEASFASTLVPMAIGMAADRRRDGRIHPAWTWGLAANFAFLILVEALTYSSIGSALYAAVTAGTPGAAVAPLAYPPFPPGFAQP